MKESMQTCGEESLEEVLTFVFPFQGDGRFYIYVM